MNHRRWLKQETGKELSAMDGEIFFSVRSEWGSRRLAHFYGR